MDRVHILDQKAEALTHLIFF